MSVTLWDGIVIGSMGGTLAGLTIWFVQSLKEKVVTELHKKRVYNWLYKRTKEHEGLTVGSPIGLWISTIEIATYTNLTKDRVRYICSVHKKIRTKLEKDRESWSDDPLEEKWAIREFVKF